MGIVAASARPAIASSSENNTVKIPEKHLGIAEAFVTVVENMLQGGGKPDGEVVRSGHMLLKKLEEHIRLYEFHAAVTAGHESGSHDALEESLAKIEGGLSRIDLTTTRLREILANMPAESRA